MKLLNKIRNRLSYWLMSFFKSSIYQMKRSKFNGSRLVNTRFSNNSVIGSIENLNIGNHVFVGHYNFIDASNGITIEDGCQITNYVSILTHSSHISIRLYGYNYSGSDMIGYLKGSVFIGKFSFIGPHSVIMPGSKIGKGSIVSAYSIVKGEFPAFSIIAGNPATVVGDTRKLDEKYLNDNPELKTFYEEWIK